jgi:hypothetical protein
MRFNLRGLSRRGLSDFAYAMEARSADRSIAWADRPRKRAHSAPALKARRIAESVPAEYMGWRGDNLSIVDLPYRSQNPILQSLTRFQRDSPLLTILGLSAQATLRSALRASIADPKSDRSARDDRKAQLFLEEPVALQTVVRHPSRWTALLSLNSVTKH